MSMCVPTWLCLYLSGCKQLVCMCLGVQRAGICVLSSAHLSMGAHLLYMRYAVPSSSRNVDASPGSPNTGVIVFFSVNGPSGLELMLAVQSTGFTTTATAATSTTAPGGCIHSSSIYCPSIASTHLVYEATECPYFSPIPMYLDAPAL